MVFQIALSYLNSFFLHTLQHRSFNTYIKRQRTLWRSQAYPEGNVKWNSGTHHSSLDFYRTSGKKWSLDRSTPIIMTYIIHLIASLP
jgi:hypothetical protein